MPCYGSPAQLLRGTRREGGGGGGEGTHKLAKADYIIRRQFNQHDMTPGMGGGGVGARGGDSHTKRVDSHALYECP